MHDAHSPEDHIGTECPHCGTVHRVLQSLPDRPLTTEGIETMQASRRFEYVKPIAYTPGGGSGADDVTEAIVVSTSDSTRLVSRYEGTGWVVEQEVHHSPEDDPAAIGEEVWLDASQALSDAMQQALGDPE